MYYTLYTYRYTNQPDLTLQWEPADPARTVTIAHVLQYYTTMGILHSHSVQQIDATQEELEDLLIMLGYTDGAVNPTSYEIMKPLLKSIPMILEPIATTPILGYVEFFQQRWYVPLFTSTALPCKPVPTHLPSILMEWYESELEATRRANILCRSQQVYQAIWDRCAALISKESNQQIPPPAEEQDDPSAKEVINEYLKLYLEPTKDKDLLLSDAYKDYKAKLEKIDLLPVSQASFIKQLRSHPYKIVRQARGMVITNYSIAAPHSVMYMRVEEAYRLKHVAILKQYKRKYPPHPNQPPHMQEAYFLLYAATDEEPTYQAMHLFLSERTVHIVKAFEPYLSTLEADHEEIMHDDLNDVRIVEKRRDIIHRVCVPFKFPFSKEIVEKGREMGNMLTAYDGSVFMNQYSYE
jgi:hypothetical protein